MLKNIFFAGCLLVTSLASQAGLISGTHTLSDGRNVDLQGLEWMPLTYTQGLSRVDVERGFSDVTKVWGAGGWRYATRNETERLLGSLWGGRFDGWSHDNFAGASSFLKLFGATDTKPNAQYKSSEFLFGHDGECSSHNVMSCRGVISAYEYWSSRVQAKDRLAGWRETTSFVPANKVMGFFREDFGVNTQQYNYNEAIHKSYARSIAGSLLVRSMDTPVAPVSSPPALSLFALGLCCLLLRRRKIAA
jgi:hypothetical protein